MNFERGVDPKKTLGIGEFGKRGLLYEEPWIKGDVLQYHVKHLVGALDGWYHFIEEKISIFQFPNKNSFNADERILEDNYPKYVITAAPGEPTDYDSIYRKIEYPEIVSRFWKLARESWEFRFWIFEKNESLANFLKLEIE